MLGSGPYVLFCDHEVVDTLGNNNGRIDPDETGELVLTLRNAGNETAAGVEAEIRSGDARFTIPDPTATFGDIAAGASADNADNPFVVHADASIPMETQVPCTLFIQTTDFADTTIFTVTVGELRDYDPVPDGPRLPPLYWAYDECDTAYSECPDFAWVEISGVGTQLSLGDDATVTLNLPTDFTWSYYGTDYTQLSVCGNGFLGPGSMTTSTWTNTVLPNASMPPIVAVSWDDMYPPTGGGVWYYYDTANRRFIVEWDSVAYYSPRDSMDKFQFILYEDPAPNGDNPFVVQFLTTNNMISNTVGTQDPTRAIAIQCLFDGSYRRGVAPLAPGRAIKYTPVDPVTGLAELPPARLPSSGASVRAWPNPFTDKVTLGCELAGPATVDLRVYDNNGRLVRTLARDEPVTRRGRFAWDGRDEAGTHLAPGIYFCRLSSDDGEAWGKVVLSH